MRLVAVLIVRDEAARLPGCLSSLAGVVDAVHVHDTGSSDETVSIARAGGAIVTEGVWRDDFAAARNEALLPVTADWALSIDADQKCHAFWGNLRLFLSEAAADVVRVEIDNVHDEMPYTHAEGRLFRPGRTRWAGRVHERLTGAGPATTAPRDTIHLTHDGYATPAERRAKASRNVRLARRELQELTEPADVARCLLDLGRSLVAAGAAQDAVDTFETLRDLFPGTPQWLEGTDFLARILLGAGLDEACLVLTAQLRAGEAGREYCDWLEAQARAQLGDLTAAARLIEGVTEVVDTAGRRQNPQALREMRSLIRSAAHTRDC